MSEFIPDTEAFSSLKGTVVVLTGGSTGMGAATTRLLVQYGANVVFGDTNKPSAEALVRELDSSHTATGKATFIACDVRSYNDIYNLFQTAYKQYGRVDHAVSCAGIFEVGKWFDEASTIESIETDGPGPTAVIDVNFMGTANFSRIAVVFLRASRTSLRNDRSLTLISSVEALHGTPGMCMYQPAKHAVQGFMRAIHKPIYERDHIRVNNVCPGVTESNMSIGLIDIFIEKNLFWQPAMDLAKVILGIQVRDDMVGKAVYVQGGDAWEFEDTLKSTERLWLGREAYRRTRINAEAIEQAQLIKL